MDQPHAEPSVMDAIATRSSVRAYTGKPLDRAAVMALLEAAVRAPTAMHIEPWRFLVIQDTDTLRRLSERARLQFTEELRRLHPDEDDAVLARFASPGFDVFYNAGTLVVVYAGVDSPFAAADCWLAAENLILAAHARGLGTCVVGSVVATLNTPAVRDELGLPAGVTAVAPVIVGHPHGEWPPSARKAPEILLWR